MLGYFRQDFLSEEALAWLLDTIRDYMSDMKKPNHPSPLTTLKVPGNSRYKETSYLGTELGRWLPTLPLYGQILTDSCCTVDDKVMDMVTGCHQLVTHWLEGIRGHHASHQNLLELYR